MPMTNSSFNILINRIYKWFSKTIYKIYKITLKVDASWGYFIVTRSCLTKTSLLPHETDSLSLALGDHMISQKNTFAASRCHSYLWPEAITSFEVTQNLFKVSYGQRPQLFEISLLVTIGLTNCRCSLVLTKPVSLLSPD